MTVKKERVLIIMPAHNEAGNIIESLESFAAQTRRPDALWVVDDSSTDHTAQLVRDFGGNHPWVHLAAHRSEPEHRPGAKVVRAFRAGLPMDWETYDYIGKFDADIVLPPTYFEDILQAFAGTPSLGICSGLLYIEREGKWVYEPVANREHVRGPVKLYATACLKAIGGLRPAMGWDTADVLMAQYHGFRVRTLEHLKVRHLRPTGSGYSKQNARLQGAGLYNLRYGWALSMLAAAKMSLKRKDPFLPWHALSAYATASIRQEPRLLSREEGRFVRNLRWRNIYTRLIKGFGNGTSGSAVREGDAE